MIANVWIVADRALPPNGRSRRSRQVCFDGRFGLGGLRLAEHTKGRHGQFRSNFCLDTVKVSSGYSLRARAGKRARMAGLTANPFCRFTRCEVTGSSVATVITRREDSKGRVVMEWSGVEWNAGGNQQRHKAVAKSEGERRLDWRGPSALHSLIVAC